VVWLAAAVLTDHALKQLARRRLAENDVRMVLAEPDTVESVRVGRVVAQNVFHHGVRGRNYFLRVFVDVDRVPPEIVT
jgi:hypothetical protein